VYERAKAIERRLLDAELSDCLDETLELYFQQCSILISAHDLAVMEATLANGGVNPETASAPLRQSTSRTSSSVMHTCAMYNYAGECAYRVDIPAKAAAAG
jgi:glutaminase